MREFNCMSSKYLTPFSAPDGMTAYLRCGFVPRVGLLLAAAGLLHAATPAPTLPAGHGKQVTITVCGKCHSPERAAALHQSRRAWAETISKMVSMGAVASDDQLNDVLNYLAKNFPPPPRPPVDINTATPVEMESSLLLLKSEAAAIIRYRTEHGNFKSLDDLRKVPGLNFHKLEEKKGRIAFGG
jgi:competence protein ComEA